MTDQAVHTGGPAPHAAGAADRFVGRQRELEGLRADIGRAGLDTLSGRPAPHARVLLVAGRPGSGRTALAEEFVQRVAGEYPDGVLRARLGDPDGTPVPTERTARALLGALGRPAAAGADGDELAAALRTALADRRALLLLDDAATADQLLDLLPESRGCLVVAVSRGPLTGVPDVRPCTLGGLDAGSAVALLARHAGTAPRIAVDPRAAEDLAEVCEGRPAALVLAGGWLAAHPAASVADAVRQLTGLPDAPHGPSDGSAPAADRPLVRAFHLVYGSLPPSAARLLRLLALAPAGLADAHTASALAGEPLTASRAVLEDGVRLGLLRATPVPGQYAVPGCLAPLLSAALAAEERPAEVLLARARMLERTVRRLRSCRAAAEPPGSPARRRAAGEPRSVRFETPAAAAAWLDTRLPALLAAARAAAADGELDTLARRLACALVRALEAHRGPEGAAPEAYRLHELAADAAGRRGLYRERAAALLRLGGLDTGAGRRAGALARYRAALEAARAGGREGEAAAVRALEALGDTYAELGDRHRAVDWYGRALALCQTRGDLQGEARLHGRIGAVRLQAEEWEEGLRAWRAAAAAHRRRHDAEAYARALEEVARAQEAAGRPRESLRVRREALRWVRRDGGARLWAALGARLADLCDLLGRTAAARAYREEAYGADGDGEARRTGAGPPGGARAAGIPVPRRQTEAQTQFDLRNP